MVATPNLCQGRQYPWYSYVRLTAGYGYIPEAPSQYIGRKALYQVRYLLMYDMYDTYEYEHGTRRNLLYDIILYVRRTDMRLEL